MTKPGCLPTIVLAIALGGCGISAIKCYIETDEELLNRVLKENQNGQETTQNTTQEKSEAFQQNGIKNQSKKRLPATNARRNPTIKI